MGGAAHHRAVPPEDERYRGMNATELRAFAKEKFNLVFDPESRKAGHCVSAMRAVVGQLVDLQAETVCERIVREFKDETGVEHEVLLQPPYHSDLQPIELVWAEVKRRIGRAVDAGTTMDVVLERLKEEFRRLEDGRTVAGAIGQTDALAQKLMEEDFAILESGDGGEPHAGASGEDSGGSSDECGSGECGSDSGSDDE